MTSNTFFTFSDRNPTHGTVDGGEEISMEGDKVAQALSLETKNRDVWTASLDSSDDEKSAHQGDDHMFRPRGLPPVAILEVYARGRKDEWFARPRDALRGQETPRITISHNHKRCDPRFQPKIGDCILARLEKQKACNETGEPVYRARTIKRLKRYNDPRMLGIFRVGRNGRAYVEPVSRKSPGFCFVEPGKAVDASPGQLVLAEVQRRRHGGVRWARILESYTLIDSDRALAHIAVRAHELPSVFSHGALLEAQQARQRSFAGEREDLRHIPFITIDPEDARDHDDAVWAEPDKDPNNLGGAIVFVAIADVAHYVRSHGALDRDARLRGNSVYFPGQVLPMLPECISNDLCSLRAGIDRPVLAVRMVFSADGQKKQHHFTRAIIRSISALSYEKAEAILRDQSPEAMSDTGFSQLLRSLWAAYKIVAWGREVRAPLEIDLAERKVLLNEDGSISQITTPPRLGMHRLIEEFMIQANVAAAEVLEHKETPLLYRVHDSPSEDKMENLRTILGALKLGTMSCGDLRPSHFNSLLSQSRENENEFPVQEMILRAQSRAEYATINHGHFGLNLPRYTHFTSPIRRYSDLIVHRSLIRILGLGDDGLTDQELEELQDIAMTVSFTERRAIAAERDTLDRLIAHYLKDEVGSFFDAVISSVTRAGLFIRLLETGADGFIPKAWISSEPIRYDERQQAFFCRYSKGHYQIGKKLRVKLTETAPLAGSLRFSLSETRNLPIARTHRKSNPHERGRSVRRHRVRR